MDTSGLIVFFGVLSILCCISYGRAQHINTTHGDIIGLRTLVLGKPVDVYYGIPFAKPPVGKLRFKHPESADHWRPEVKDARTMKPSCEQKLQNITVMPWRTVPPLMSEDCLYINVWVPVNAAPNTKLSTMVWIYGGSFNTGSINMPLYNGQNLAAEQNVIVMSINYRLGALGFLYTGRDTFPGNQGMMDQVLAMKWIYNNVERFGGDQKSITLFGESAGAASVSHHLLSPLSRDYFTRAILQSGASNSIWAYGSTSFAKGNARILARNCGCLGKTDSDVYDCMKEMPSGTILDKQSSISARRGITFGPIVDGYFLPDTPEYLLKNRKFKNTEILLGVNKDEGNMFLFYLLPFIFAPQNDIRVSKLDFHMVLSFFTIALGKSSSFSRSVAAEYVDPLVASLRNYADISDDILGDSMFKCPIVSLANSFARNKSVYLYSFEHKLSSIPAPRWVGVTHSFELEFVFGHPLGNMVKGTDQERILTRQIMYYWTQFAKTGNPNLPNQPVTWPEYDQIDEKYLVLDLPGKMTTRQGLRKQQCVFWNTLVPMILGNRM